MDQDIKTKGILNITVRRLSDIERAEIHIDVKPNAKRATKLR